MSSVLETFFILFKSNADEVEKGGKKAADTSEKLDKSLKKVTEDSHQTGEAFNAIMERAAGALAGILAVGTAIAAVNSTVKQTQDLRLASMETGNGVDQIDAMQRATKRFGGTVEETNGVIKNLNAQILDTAFSGEGSLSPVLRRLGMNLRNAKGDIVKPIELLDNLNTAFQRVSKRESLNLGHKMGLSDAMILMLQQTPEAYQKAIVAAKKYGAVTAEQIDMVNKFDMTLNDMSASMGVTVRNSVMWAIPLLQKFLETVTDITDYLSNHKNLVEGFFIGISTILAVMYIPTMLTAAAATLAATWPIFAIILAVTAAAVAFGLLYDDVKTFFEGGDSMLGEAIKKWPALGGIIKDLASLFKLLFEGIQWGAQLVIGHFTGMLNAAEMLLEGVEAVTNWILEKFPALAPVIEALGNPFETVMNIAFTSLQAIFDFFKMVFGGIKSGLDFLDGKVKDVKAFFGIEQNVQTTDDVNAAKKAIDFSSSAPIASQSSTSVANTRMGNKNFDVTTGDIIIQTNEANADGISAAVGQTLAQHMRHALYNIDDGISA